MYAEEFTLTLTLTILPPGDAGFDNDGISLDSTETLDLSSSTLDVAEFVESVGSLEVTLTQQVRLVSISDDFLIVLENTDLTTVSVEISDQTTISAPAEWDQILYPPTEITTDGIVSAGFETPTISIQVGSPDVVLVFDSAVTIILEGITGQTAYKLSGTDNWVLISGCTGTYDNPDHPPTNGECSISNGTDTKILTYHFTEFTELTETVVIIETTTRSGHGPTGVGPGSSNARGGSNVPVYSTSTVSVFPDWFKTIAVNWWIEDLISDKEFKSLVNYLLDEKIIPIELTEKPSSVLGNFAPATKHFFNLWANDKLDESQIISQIQYYRTLGIW